MSAPDEKWLEEYPHRLLVQKALIDMVKATQCNHCGKIECKSKLDTFPTTMFISEGYVSPRCSFDLSGSKIK
jgi:hypothetical protein